MSLRFDSPKFPIVPNFFRKSPIFDENSGEIAEIKEPATTDFSRIRCPLCRWQPQALHRWCCSYAPEPPHCFTGGCGMIWNTFETRGRCPGCDHQWTYTDCLRCFKSSPHEAWYEDAKTI